METCSCVSGSLRERRDGKSFIFSWHGDDSLIKWLLPLTVRIAADPFRSMEDISQMQNLCGDGIKRRKKKEELS
jgi:hypothetical protein